MKRLTGRRDLPDVLRDFYQRIQALERYRLRVPLSTYRFVCTSSTNAQVISADPCFYYGHYVNNDNDTEFRYAHLYNKATTPTGADTPKLTLGIPYESGANQEYANGVEFDVGLGIALSTSPSSLVAVTANEMVVTIMYAL